MRVHSSVAEQWIADPRVTGSNPVVPFCLLGGTGRIWFLGDGPSQSPSYVHTRVKAPDPIRTPKLSILGPAQYYGGGPRGNRR